MLKIDRERFWRNGYLVVRRLFAPQEFEEMRRRVLESLRQRESKGAAPVDALADPLVREYVHDRRVLDVARFLLERSEIAYFGDGSYAVVGHNYEPGKDVGGFHRDNTDRSDTGAPDWRGRYGLIRFGFYLQDHRYTSGGLMVRRTSHDRILRGWKSHLYDRYLNNGLGDVGVWSMRIQHAGLGRCVRGLPGLALGPAFQRKLPQFLQAPFGKEARAALWISYGSIGEHLERHCEYLLGRSERLEMWQHSHYAPEVLQACRAAGLEVIDMPARMRAAVKQGKPVGQHRHHYQMPY